LDVTAYCVSRSCIFLYFNHVNIKKDFHNIFAYYDNPKYEKIIECSP
jgi:hypothetical protein